jgi:hypothetical protein
VFINQDVLRAVAARARARASAVEDERIEMGKLIATTQATVDGVIDVLGDRGTIRMELADVKRFDSGVVLLTYLPAS